MEFCLLCSYGQLNSENTAAWVQAWGTLLALVVALAIAGFQGNREIKLRTLDRKEKRLRELRRVLFLARAMEQWILDFQNKYPHVVVYDKPSETEAVGDLLSEIRTTTTDELDDAELDLYFRLRREFSEIFGHVTFGDAGIHVAHHLVEIRKLIPHFANVIA